MSLSIKKLTAIAKNEGSRFAKQSKGQKFFVANMKIADKDGTYDLPVEVLQATAAEYRKRNPNTAVMLVTVNNSCARLLVDAPESANISADDWMNATSVGGDHKELEDGEFLKFRDIVVNEAFDYLKKQGLMDEESDDEVCFTFDD